MTGRPSPGLLGEGRVSVLLRTSQSSGGLPMPAMLCRRLYPASVMAMLLVTCWSGPAWGEQVIRLGGMRNVTATVSESDETYRIAVEMLPVRAFDPATNKALNLSKGRMYAAQALAKHLKAGSLTIRGLEIRESGTSGNTFRLVAVVPRDGVSVGAGTVRCPRTAQDDERRQPTRRAAAVRASSQHEIRLAADATTADFLSRKADYLDTIVRLQEALTEEGESLERQSLKPEDFYDSIGSIEERADAAFKAIAGQIDDDNLLLSLEQEELRPLLKKAHVEVLKMLKAAVARFRPATGGVEEGRRRSRSVRMMPDRQPLLDSSYTGLRLPPRWLAPGPTAAARIRSKASSSI